MKKKCKLILTLMLSNRKLMLLLYRLQMMLNAHLKKDTLERYLVLLLRFGHERMCNLYESTGVRGLNVSGDLLMLSNVTFDEQVLPTTHGQLNPPLGKHRLKISLLFQPNQSWDWKRYELRRVLEIFYSLWFGRDAFCSR
ncbi:SAPS domain-containing protein [Artemisia annua]|uniref:SAPS domain-containing protein n=1 Tax=Artemisia annua TaxID=35608 RepID=A0A2U1NA51_ARTAN|nr:SAPS domain-containing protein [Artemisia annua]